MSTTVTTTEAPRYEYYYRDNHNDNQREVLTGSRAVETFTEIPVVDVSRIFSESLEERKAVAKEIGEVCKTIGFMYIKGHGIAQELVDDVFALSKQYHAQADDVKMKEYIYDNKELRGFDHHFVNTPAGPILRKESFIYSYNPDYDAVPPTLTPEQREMCLGVYNQFPATPETFQEKLIEYQRKLIVLSRKMLQSFALGLDVEETYFAKYVTAPFVSIMLHHYLPTDPNAADLDSLGAHTDFESKFFHPHPPFTILNQDSVGGLEILNKNGIYVPAPYIHGTFVVNIGDFLERISNDQFVSTVHRVRNATGKERYSMPFFFGFNMDANIGVSKAGTDHDPPLETLFYVVLTELSTEQVLPSCTSPENPAKYPPRNLYQYTKDKRATQRKHHEEPGFDNPLAT